MKIDSKNAPALHFLGVIHAADGEREKAVALFREALSILPDSPEIYLSLATALKETGEIDDAKEAVQKLISMDPDNAEGHILYGNILKASASPKLHIGKEVVFERLESHLHGMVLFGVSLDGKKHIKIEVKHHPRKKNSVEQEFNIMKHLNDKGCVTCPEAFQHGMLSIDKILPLLNDPEKILLKESGKTEVPFLTQEYIKTGPTLNLEDAILAVLEQKTLGVYQGDLKPDNLKIDEEKKLVYLVDYDQAVFLDENTINMSSPEFFAWCDEKAKEWYKFTHFLQYFQNMTYELNVAPMFRNGAFNLGLTTLYKAQKTTLSACGIYHTIDNHAIYSDGERSLNKRTDFLDLINFKKREKVFDLGCNAGLLSMYLADRGCDVLGVELDSFLLRGAKIIANILGKDVRYESHDMDSYEMAEDFDTVMLFSVIHHTQKMKENGAKLAKHCNRIIIECRLKESGAKPVGDRWVQTTVWNYDTVDHLVQGLEELFPNFKLKKNYGKVDRERYIMELEKC